MPRKPSKSTTSTTSTKSTTQGTSRAHSQGTSRYVFCPGSGLTHEQVFLEVMAGPKVRFMTCPIGGCGAKVFLRGPAWLSPTIGVSRVDARNLNPNAFIF